MRASQSAHLLPHRVDLRARQICPSCIEVVVALARDWPEQLDRYEDLYAHGAYLPRVKVEPVRQQVRGLARAHGVRDRRTAPLVPPPEPVQLSLGV